MVLKWFVELHGYALGLLHNYTQWSVLENYKDDDWNILLGDSLSTTCNILNMGGAICWKWSKNQSINANWTMEAELIELVSTTENANWLKDLLNKTPNLSLISVA